VGAVLILVNRRIPPQIIIEFASKSHHHDHVTATAKTAYSIMNNDAQLYIKYATRKSAHITQNNERKNNLQ
jgi:hypothetical protein